MHNVVWGCAEILPCHLSTIKELCNSNRREELRNATRGSKKARHEKGTEFFYTKADGLNQFQSGVRRKFNTRYNFPCSNSQV